ncbi:MAG: zf-TFIIB domain-containing protein [Thermodesulfobacteriota bacterium]
MNCPRCEDAVLEERDREGVVVDACRSCRGVWLDRGELERLIARATSDYDELDRFHGERRRDARRGDDLHERCREHERRGHGPPRRKRWFEALGDIFD